MVCHSRMLRYTRLRGMVQEGQKYEMQFRMPRGSQNTAKRKRRRAMYLAVLYAFG